MALPDNGLFGAVAGKKNPYPQLKLHRLKLHRLATANDRLRVAESRALPMREITHAETESLILIRHHITEVYSF